MQDVLAKADKMILNKSSIQLDDHNKVSTMAYANGEDLPQHPIGVS